MNAAMASEIARLETMTITKVVERFESLFGEECRSRNKRYPIRRIPWRLQANAEGDLSERARARAAELALDSEVCVTAPRETIQPKICNVPPPISTCLGPALATSRLDALSRVQGQADPRADRE